MSLPVIDISGDPRGVADEVGAACGEIGFLTVVGHGVPEDLVEQTASVARTFFDLPDPEKRTLAEGEATPGLPAYRPLRSESLAASLGQKTPGDLKESLDWGPAVPGFGWPDRPPGLRPALEGYYEAVSELGERLRRLFALALDLPEDWFEDTFPRPLVEHARSQLSRPRARRRAGPAAGRRPHRLRLHDDPATEDAPGGLQVQTRDGDWLDVHAVPGSFVVNLGDMMARWTNDRWRATLHRVAVPPADRELGSRRQTIVFFHDPRADAVIECIPGCSDAEHPPLYEPVTALEHIQAKAARALTAT
jgi:isopenicillin N synthase-like dioxygenase